MVFDIWCTEPYMTPMNLHIMVVHAPGNCQNNGLVWLAGSSCWHHGCCQLELGIDWPVNPLIQVDSTESLWKHLQNSVILCHFVSLLGMLCHLGGWDNGCRHMISTRHKLHKPDKQHSVLLTNLVLGLLDRQVLRHLILQSTFFDWGCTILGGVCQLDFWKNCQRKA